ncbi:MAG: hypothetical protein A3J07_00935 [Candidatus Doudnabacteria bacterium RIFCSPLOWO2_02_FULL_49_13]|uniref:Mannosyl-glycoprotein endo-beta-N-acetylglucosamidase-like domain-containing protein n=1 Tax=Candidatus Doudnabacteria bacterium RIFCSPHIGHO2_12_FULL_48_16 TaxID=1817838 RepID=A0A1F5PK42_9BACT|nr:MAG: hypothetical protein A3B77_04500 [Candidatus Doudnabacteria bacterium RIFCSPHIGHO2_02_FULL_49_24]OGE89914.1 MAG: hypothetical protein A2760_04395 [Candidatus Doudnabacteria bacterium RIFCSPHIGHO2_01_FULL_50_67]OGE90315.1 MAG: hypothetical protein A3E29_04445 [Candidatus Doudnabacteria bacterium RIFCSPHIGHO2_12_FULL_48_16]OGE96743.1 MAG: hypothetical protein A2990_00435 [Candidatus Doudnabacteria bacterium RIFCSPLOWO2_01_FULL_49_40]OGF02371.1 MAG: hypothetical protein A3J07_00935 [Candid
MDIDIVRKIKNYPLKASFNTLALRHKFSLTLFLLGLLATLVPHVTYAQPPLLAPELGPALVFESGISDYEDYLSQLNQDLTDEYYQRQAVQQAIRQQKLATAVGAYLASQRSPLAPYASTLVSLRNWKKITALANAESTLCRRYPLDKANCWGVGGSDLWDMGDNLGEGVIAMNRFLNKYPLRSTVKYSQMSFERMNGLYKQPPGDHWVNNNKSVYNDLVAIESSIE